MALPAAVASLVYGLALLYAYFIDGPVYPDSLQHYTTLIVQGFDLGMLLPLAFVSGWLLIRRKPLRENIQRLDRSVAPE